METRFYNPSITNFQNKEVQRDADAIQNYFEEMKEKFSKSLNSDAIKQSFLPNQPAQNIIERTRLFGELMELEKGLQWVRFIDAGGLRIRFSTSPDDIVSQTNNFISYKNYNEITPFIPYAKLAVPQGGPAKITMDQQNERIIISFPFIDYLDTYRGTAMYSLSARAVEDRLIMEGRIKVGECLSIIAVPPGIVSGLPNTGKESILSTISSIWQEGTYQLTSLNSHGSSAVLVSTRTNHGFNVGRVVSESIFDFPQVVKIIILFAVFLTIFLTTFLVFNMRPDMMTVVQNRLKRLQFSLIRDYYERKGEIDWNLWRYELEQRREDVRAELKRGIKSKPTSMLKDIDILIDKSWNEILEAIGDRREPLLVIDEDKLQNILKRMLLAAGNPPAIQTMTSISGGTPAVQPMAQLAEEEALEELDSHDELEEPIDVEESPELKFNLLDLGIDIEELTLDELKSREARHTTAKPDDTEVDNYSLSIGSGPADNKASEIEFGASMNEDDSLPDLVTDVEIVSPFSELLSPFEEKNNYFTNDNGKAEETKTSGYLEELNTDYTMSLVYKPFQNEDAGELQELPPAGTGVIKQKNGIHYVNKDVKAPNIETIKTLDPGLKSLVDSVIGKK
jgi:hypothetical protein